MAATFSPLVDGVNYYLIPGKHANSRLIIMQNHAYRIGKRKIEKGSGKTLFYLLCRDHECPARALIKDNFLTTNAKFKEHKCAENGATANAWRAKESLSKMKTRAKSESGTLQSIYNTETLGLTEGVRALLNYDSCVRAMKLARSTTIPTCPDTLDEVIPKLEAGEYPELYQKQYLGHVSWEMRVRSGQRSGPSQSSQGSLSQQRLMQYAILLGNNEVIERIIQESTDFFGDGTFKITCRQARAFSGRSAQVFNFVADFNGRAIIIFSLVMTCRKFQLYKKAFQKIREMFPSFEPRVIMLDFETSARRAFSAVWPNTRILGCRFHFSKCLYSKLKSKFRLAGWFRPTGSVIQRQISFLIRQYFSIPLIKPQHMQGEVCRLEKELRELASKCTRDVAKRLNRYHNYVVRYWLQHQGSNTISVCGANHKTNNLTERFNAKLNRELPAHPSLFLFMNKMDSVVFSNGLSIVAQTDAGRQPKKAVNKIREVLVRRAEDLEREYLLGNKTAAEVLQSAATHYDDEKLIRFLNDFAEQEEERVLTDGRDIPVDDGIPDLEPPLDPMDVDEAERELEEDEDLRELPGEDGWVTVDWPFISADSQNHPGNDLAAGERIEDVAVIICVICTSPSPNMVRFTKCPHLVCRTCFSRVDKCPYCKQLKGRGKGQNVNISTLQIVRKDEAAADFGLSEQVREASSTHAGRRPGDETEAEFAQRRDQEAIQEALNEGAEGAEGGEDENDDPFRPLTATPGPSQVRTSLRQRNRRLRREEITRMLEEEESGSESEIEWN